MADVPSRELQMLVNDPRWPSFHAWLVHGREQAVKGMCKRGQEHHEMTRFAGEIAVYDEILKPLAAEATNPPPQE